MNTTVYATNVNVPDYMISAGVKYRIIKDHLGSPRLTVKTTDGTVAQRIDYTDLGRVITNTSPYLHPFGFAGGIIEHYTRLVKFGARFYDTDTGRWTTKDPIRFGGGDTNLFSYVANDPINWTDPTGLARGDWWDPRTYVYPVVEAGQGTGDFVRNYNNMRSANTIGADKYFHCMANCQATQRGPGGQTAAEIIGEGRELTDQYIKGDSRQECDKDRAANAQGRNGAGGGACSQVCGSLRPNGLGSQW